MILSVEVTTSSPDLFIDYIEVRLGTGQTVSLNWDESEIERTETGFSARYKGVCFGEEYANGRIRELQNMKVDEVGLYSESGEVSDFTIEKMVFEDGENLPLTIYNAYHIQEDAGKIDDTESQETGGMTL